MATFVQKMQRRIAQVSLSPSVVRGSGAKGVLGPVRDFLAGLSLGGFAAPDEQAFGGSLDRATDDLLRCIPRGARSWGLARKCMNLFLREAFYNAYLLNEYDLARAEQWYEIPLDSQVAAGLIDRARKESPPHALPRWRGLKQLEKSDSDRYQRYALERAPKEGFSARVHFDLDLWRPEAADEAL